MATPEEHRYFVSYTIPGGFGRSEVTLRLPIRGIEDVAVVEKLLRETNGRQQIVVMGWQRFEKG